MRRVISIPKLVPEQWINVNQTTHVCDWCAKEVSDHGEMLIGGFHNGGWYHVSRTPKSTGLDELRRRAEWDFCSFECLSLWLNDGQNTER